ncbi:MAG: co-chaperone GroES family protein [Ignavibacteriales bacterium]|jgi:Co-chaperonin GroES (HSP10)|nr:MAG: co-chaperone GroES [Ignavibacteriaceae bacterium]MBW7873745.1 co-chaperone GroES [Ignavibacteria bacterium]MCZ2143971.1 co-chaperone GroES family protein [Ignavibacteriales bacterium]MBV6444643.1 10 kDa chaperonin [Ignavibacteriaceae bacterium]MBZ0197739.1 co-chaperone GroES family protein [Ignavibacteriaceae bacterium]
MRDIHKFIVVGDKVLVKPLEEEGRTHAGLYLPPGVTEKEKVQSGYVLKTGPGYPIALPSDDEPWKEKESTRYIGLQAQEGDMAIYQRKDAIEIEYDREKLVIVPQTAILLLIRDDFTA